MIVTFVVIDCHKSLAAPRKISRKALLPTANAHFQRTEFHQAIKLYRAYLRLYPKDYNTWNRIGASYYHTGLPKRGLRYLKHVERKTTNKSYNYYYQGLCYTAVNKNKKSKEYFTYVAARFKDEYASRATFEMAVIEYNLHNKRRTKYWVNLYLQRFPGGVHTRQAHTMMQSMQRGEWLEDVSGIAKPDMEKALYKYNHLSLYEKPHFWFFQFGSQSKTISGFEPTSSGKLKATNEWHFGLAVNGGVGLGPWRKDDYTAFGGYNYRQLWLTSQDRLSAYQEDFSKIEYIPFRADLLERRHQFYGDFRRKIAKKYFVGAFTRWEFARIGSSIFPSPEDSDLNKVLKISDTQLMIPWIGMSVLKNQRTLAYLYLRKEINSDSPEHSNKSYQFGAGSSPTFSYGVSHTAEFPKYRFELNGELFQYDFIYNDFWLDYKRQGLIVSAEHEMMPNWYISGLFGYYKDTYLLPRLKQHPCGSQPEMGSSESPSSESPTVNRCWRDDTGTLLQGGLYWNWTQFRRFSGYIQQVKNDNAQQKEFQQSKMVILLNYTIAFPSVKRVIRYVDRFADSAFTKEAQ